MFEYRRARKLVRCQTLWDPILHPHSIFQAYKTQFPHAIYMRIGLRGSYFIFVFCFIVVYKVGAYFSPV